jgi:hypothetical protein
MTKERDEQVTAVSKGHLRHPPSQVQRRQGRHQGAQKPDHPECQTGQSGLPESGQYVCSRVLIHQVVQDSTVEKFRGSGSSSVGLSSDALPFSRATNAQVVGASTDDVSALSTLGGVVQIVGYTAMHFHLGWSGQDEGFGHRGYYIGDGRYGSVGDK